MSDYREVAVLGDSIANGFFDETGAGWVGRLIAKLNSDKPYGYYCNNFAVDGDRVFDAWHRLCSDVIKRRPDVLLISIGTNDVIRWNEPSMPMDISVEMRDEFWRLLLETAKKNVPEIIVLGQLPVDESKMPATGIFDKKLWYLNADVKAYNAFLKDICGQFNVPLHDFYDEFTGLAPDAFLYEDGVHLNTAGHEHLACLCYEVLKG